MKRKAYIIFTIIVSAVFSSCSDYLDVKPENQILQEDFWKQKSDVEAVVLSCYRGMIEEDFMWRVIAWGEIRSDNVMPGSGTGGDEQQLYNVSILPTNGDSKWGAFYEVINYCNAVLKFAPQVVQLDPNFTQADLHAKQGEALAVRALCYFYLVRTFKSVQNDSTLSVPLVLEPTESDNTPVQVAQSPSQAILDTITNNLLQAEQWAPESFPTTIQTKGRMTKDAIRAILADVYLWKQDYANCILYCDKLIDATQNSKSSSGIVTTEPKYEMDVEDEDWFSTIFNRGNSSESIFELQFSSGSASNTALSKLYGKSDQAFGQWVATTAYANGITAFPATDTRRGSSINISSATASLFPIFKYRGEASSYGLGSTASYIYTLKTTTANWIFYRITDIMLMKAEALVQLNPSQDNLLKALVIVNKTYMRANPTLAPADSLRFNQYNTADAMEKLVQLERQRELMFEGKRWFDLVRQAERKQSTQNLTGYLVNKYSTDIATITSKLSVMNSLYMPVNADELKVNPLLKQNPYYATSSNIQK